MLARRAARVGRILRSRVPPRCAARGIIRAYRNEAGDWRDRLRARLHKGENLGDTFQSIDFRFLEQQQYTVAAPRIFDIFS
jgi:hypothetical protein